MSVSSLMVRIQRPRNSSGLDLLGAPPLVAACGNDATLLRRSGRSLEAQVSERLATLRNALCDEDAPRLRAASHKLCMMIAVFSIRVCAAASDLENCAVAANRSDHLEILPTVVSFPVIGGRPGRPCTHPYKLYADAGFDCEATRSILRWLGIEPHIRHRDGEHGSHLGRVRWVVERTISRIKGLRRPASSLRSVRHID
jgi:hypothetical protein